MDVSTNEKLIILLDKATSLRNSELDVTAIDAFCCAVKSEPICAGQASKLLADRIQSTVPGESLNALNLLDECMAKCGEGHKFQSMVGTFRFLNELVKLVSPKYLGAQTQDQVKTKILDLLLLWTVQYPKESKIKEAYEMLRRQGVIHSSPNPITIQKKPQPTPQSTVDAQSQQQAPVVTNNDPTANKIKQLIQSKNLDRVDIHATNLLIQNFYEIEKKKTLRVQEIRKGRENVALLNDMIDHFNQAESTEDDKSLLNELYETCKALQPTIHLLTEESQDEQVLQDALETNDQLMQVIEKYESVVVKGANAINQLLEMPSLLGDSLAVEDDAQVVDSNSSQENVNKRDELEEIFGSILNNNEMSIVTSLPALIDTVNKEYEPNVVSGVPLMATKPLHLDDMNSLISEMMRAKVNEGSKEEPVKIVHNFEGISVDLNSIEATSEIPELTVLNETKGLRVTLTFTKEHPRDDIAVVVVTIANQSPNQIDNINLEMIAVGGEEFQAKVLIEGDENNRSLSGMKKFSSAVDDMAVVVLVSNPNRISGSTAWNLEVSFRLSCGEECKKSICVKELPNLF